MTDGTFVREIVKMKELRKQGEIEKIDSDMSWQLARIRQGRRMKARSLIAKLLEEVDLPDTAAQYRRLEGI